MRKMGIGLGVGINRSNYAQGIFNAYSARVVADGGVVESGTCVDAVSSLLQSASLLLIPSGYKGGKLYAEIPTNGNGDLTWTRGGDAFRTNASGVLQRVPWNLLSYSEQFSNAYWTKSNTTISIDTTTAPNGTLTADTLIEDTTNSTHRIFNNSAVTVSNTIATTYSVYLKSAGRTRAWVRDNDLLGALFNLSTGTIVSTDSGVTASITNFGDSWYRCTITKVSSSVSGRIVVYLDNGTSDSYQGDGTSGIFIWGAQAVEGATAQTYLPTTDRLNFPRLSYMYGSCPAVLLEPQRTNLALYSEQFNDTYWAKTGSSITANSTTSPDGTTTADTLIENTATSDHKIFKVFSVTASTTYTLSIYAKKNGRNLVYVFDAYTFRGTIFNLDTLATNNLGAGLISPSIVNVGNGWYRLSGSITPSGINMSFEVGVTNSTSSISYTGDGVSGAFIWGAQLEVGAYPTTYIPTTSGATATRVADSFSRNNIYTNGLISASGGTWFVELRGNVSYTRDAFGALWLGDNSSSFITGNSLSIRNQSSTSARLSIVKTIASSATTIFLTTTDTVKIAIKWNGTSADVFVNGVKEVSATAFTTTNMEFLAQNAIVPMFIQQMALYPTPLTDTQCQTLTT